MINMIAAGEVIERPASVVKELLENSIDAGATRITLEIEDGGKKLIRVIDNGYGMDSEDLSKAFKAHATSKISSVDDLMKISTMGFRGEALASIGAIAKVSIISRQNGAIEANRIDIDCGEENGVRPCSNDYGTTIEVANLFYKLPGRSKFLKTSNTEMGHVSEQFNRIALVNSEIDFTLIHNGRTLHRLSAGQGLSQRIKKLFGNGVAEDLIAMRSSERGIELTGVIGKPSSARGNSKYQYVFLNGRYIRDKFIGHAIKESYRGLIEHSKFPVVFIMLDMPMDSFDVNVHPTKVEVRFDNSNLVHSQVMAVLKETLRSNDIEARGSLDLSGVGNEQFPRDDSVKNAIADFFDTHKPVANQSNFDFGRSSSSGSGNYRPAVDTQRREFRENFYNDSSNEPIAKNEITVSQDVMQIHDSYILVSTDEGFAIVDQHALHERILYQRMLDKIADGKLESQRLLIPASFEVNELQRNAIEENRELFEKLGLDIEPFGPMTMAVQGFPSMLEKADPIEFAVSLVDMLVENGKMVNIESQISPVLAMAACKAAIKAGQKLSKDEIEHLLADKNLIERASNCPHGRPATIRFTLSQLEKQFKRT